MNLTASTLMTGTAVSSAVLNVNDLTVNTHSVLNVNKGILNVTGNLAFDVSTPNQDSAAIVMNGGDINVADLANAVSISVSEAVISGMQSDAIAYAAESGLDSYTSTVALISGLNATDKAEFQGLMDAGKLSWSLDLPQTYSVTDSTIAMLVDSGVQWNETGDTLQIYTNWNVVQASIPEPTTATLSLLALAGLAARRRR